MTEREAEAKAFAAEKHGTQTYSNDRPYTYHLEKVRDVLVDFGYDGDLLVAAWLHDTVEDCQVTRAEIAERFGAAVDELVWAVTGVGKNRKERGASAYAKIHAHPPAAILKLADRIANVEASVERPDKLGMYRSEWQKFCAALDGLGDERMWQRLEKAIGKKRDR